MPSFIGYVPTGPEYIDKFFELAPVTTADVVYDLGSGDGRLLIAAVQKGAGKAVGIDIDPEKVEMGSKNVRDKGLDGKIAFIAADVLDADLSPATLILCYLFPSASEALRPKFERELRAGTRIVMESFSVPGWKPAKTLDTGGKYFYLYVMPPELADKVVYSI